MINRIKLVWTLCIVLICSYSAWGAEDLAFVLEQFEKELLQASKKHQVPGFAVGVVQQDKIIYLKGFGLQNLASDQPVTPYTAFQIGSTSKPIAATLVGMFHTQKILSLDDLVIQYIPHFNMEKERLQIKHLLTHTTGLPRQGFNQLIELKSSTKADIIQKIKQTKAIGAPGKYFDYHNATFSLLEEVIEAATQQEFTYNLYGRLLIPLGMTHTTFSYADLEKTTDRAWPHVQDDQGKLVPCREYSQGYYKVVSAGGINSCAHDMSRFLIAQLGYRPWVVPPETLSLLHQPFIEAPDFFNKFQRTSKRFKSAYYGLGWRILTYENQKLVFHGSLLKGFVSVLMLVPEKEIGITILQNCENSFAWYMAMRLVERVLGLPARVWD
jgi:beta-lactamase class C